MDLLKYDFCFHPTSVDGATIYRQMGIALNNCGRDILFMACSWGANDTRQWIRETGAHTWRSTNDINDSWISIKDIAQGQMQAQEYNAPGCYNDMDMLVVGMNNKGNVSLGGCNEDEYKLHFALWAFLQSPLMIGCDIRNMDESTRRILLNREIIALNQDESCHKAYMCHNPLQAFRNGERKPSPTPDRGPEDPFYQYTDYCLSRTIMLRYLADGDIALIRLNFRDHTTSDAPTIVTADMLGLPEDMMKRLTITDLWTGEKLPLVNGTIPNHGIPAHGCQVYRIHIEK